MTNLPPEALPDLKRVDRAAVILRRNNAGREALDAAGDLEQIETAARRLGGVAHLLVDEHVTDRKLQRRIAKAALSGAKVAPDSDAAEAILNAVRVGYLEGVMHPEAVIIAPQARRDVDLELDIEREVEREHVRAEARRRYAEVAAEQASAGKPPMDIGTLTSLLERPDEARWCITDLLPAEGRAIVVAPNKTGKTTLLGDLMRSLVTGEPFLGRFEVEPFEGNVLLLNYEVSAAQQGRWLADLGLTKKQARRIHVANLRGTENPLSSERGRQQLIAYMREHDIAFLIVDPFGRAYPGDQDSNSAVGPWLTMLDQVATEGGAREVVLAVHAGWGSGERGQAHQVRARGASALHDWPDAIWRLSRDGDARFFEAEGRDVLLESDQLAYDPETRRLSLTGTGGRSAARRASKAAELAEPILAIVRNVQGIGTSAISDTLRRDGVAFSKGDESAAIASLMADRSLLRYRDGKVWRHYTPGNVPPKVAGVTTL